MTAVDEELRRVGLDPSENAYPRVIQEGDQIFVRVLVEGRDVECEITIRRAFIILIQLVFALARIVPR